MKETVTNIKKINFIIDKINNKEEIYNSFLQDESKVILQYIESIQYLDDIDKSIRDLAKEICKFARDNYNNLSGSQKVINEYKLSTEEGKILISYAESLLRIPDNNIINELLEEKCINGNFSNQFNIFNNIYINIVAIGMSYLKLISYRCNEERKNILRSSLNALSMPVIRYVSKYIISQIGYQFVLEKNIKLAIKAMNNNRKYHYSFDALGEAAKTEKDSLAYYNRYIEAIEAIGEEEKDKNWKESANISVKLTAIHPKYMMSKINDSFDIVYERVLALCLKAKFHNIALFIDAEEDDKMIYSFAIFDKLLKEEELKNWDCLGIVIQAYNKAARNAIKYLIKNTRKANRKICIRLVKGAYWDYELKHSQELGLPNYPVFTRKTHTDISYLVCADLLLSNGDIVYPCFATHNARTISEIIAMYNKYGYDFEFQKLYGMSDHVYDYVLSLNSNYKCRIYAPIGGFKELLSYMSRRLLESGATGIFMQKIYDNDVSIDEIVSSPIDNAKRYLFQSHPMIPSVIHTSKVYQFGKGMDINHAYFMNYIFDYYANNALSNVSVNSLINGEEYSNDNLKKEDIFSPQNHEKLGILYHVDKKGVLLAMDIAHNGYIEWLSISNDKKREIILNSAKEMEDRMLELMHILSMEAGKTIVDAIAEIKEAVDFLRYYAYLNTECIDRKYTSNDHMDSKRFHMLTGRGVIFAISPWNFPAAIFIGQIAGALMSNNTVVAKPSEQTSYIATVIINILINNGLPKYAVQLLIGNGPDISQYIFNHHALSGVVFTGSDMTANIINKSIAFRNDGVVPFIAETGGQNAMIVDSSALPEKIVDDAIMGAFKSAGQRCSATRLLYIQEEIYDETIKMLIGAASILKIGDPTDISVDIGPVIDKKALDNINSHVKYMKDNFELIYEHENIPSSGTYAKPTIFKINNIHDMKREVFGPVLHIIKYSSNDIYNIVDEINSTGYGLTFSIHTRIHTKAMKIAKMINAGNVYINRNQIGAVVLIHPFGGSGKSGTGFKAGGPNYLLRFTKSITVYETDFMNVNRKLSYNKFEKTISNISKLSGNMDIYAEHSSYIMESIPDNHLKSYEFRSVNNTITGSVDIIMNNKSAESIVKSISMNEYEEDEDAIDNIINKININIDEIVKVSSEIYGVSLSYIYKNIDNAIFTLQNLKDNASSVDEIKLPSPCGEINTLSMTPYKIGGLIFDEFTSFKDLIVNVVNCLLSSNKLIIFPKNINDSIYIKYIYDLIFIDTLESISIINCSNSVLEHLLYSNHQSLLKFIIYNGDSKRCLDILKNSSSRDSILRSNLETYGLGIHFASKNINIENLMYSTQDNIYPNLSSNNIIAIHEDEYEDFMNLIFMHKKNFKHFIINRPILKYNKDASKFVLKCSNGSLPFILLNDLLDIRTYNQKEILGSIFIVKYKDKIKFLNKSLNLGFNFIKIDIKSINQTSICSNIKIKKPIITIMQNGGICNFNNPLSNEMPFMRKNLMNEKTIVNDVYSTGGDLEFMLNISKA